MAAFSDDHLLFDPASLHAVRSSKERTEELERVDELLASVNERIKSTRARAEATLELAGFPVPSRHERAPLIKP